MKRGGNFKDLSHVHSQLKFDLIRFSVLHDITKI